jgi:2-polyprenyl-3-methyl-5-hydroxy-6-metoxy-1,4-benzoquinol methylase
VKNSTIDFYNQQTRKWVENHQRPGKSYWAKQIRKLKKLLPEGRILEIGCGFGNDADELQKSEYEYIGIDPSIEMIKIAQKNNPDTIFINKSIEDFNFKGEYFDGFWSVAALLHIPKNQIDEVLQKIKSLCKKRAIGFITLKEGEKDGIEKETGRWFAFYKEDEIKTILNRNGFEIIECKYKKDDRPNKPRWLMIFIRV